MMKLAKKLSIMVIAAITALVMAVPAFAADTYTITVNNSKAGHTYEAYQIFTGDLHEGILSNVVWGSGVSAEGQAEFGNAAKKAEALEIAADAKQFAEDIAPYLTEPAATANAQTGDAYVLSGLEAGYYLVKDKDGSLGGTTHDAYTNYIIKVVKDTTAAPKSDVPEVQKKVKDVNDSVADSTTDWQDSADYDMGDNVPFQLTATLADNVSTYATYKVAFHDTLSAGLAYNADAKVYFAGADVTEHFTIAEESGALTIACNDVRAFGATDSSVITVEYTAKLNEGAVLGSAGNPNTVYLEYSNNPNWAPEHDENGQPTNPGDSPTGSTPEDKVIVFTYKVVVNKVDEADDALTGATFALYKKDASGDYALVKEIVGADTAVFEWIGLDDGDYKIVEVKAPAGYNKIEDIEFTVSAKHDVLSDNPALTELNGGDLFTGDVEIGALSTDIENKSGVTLPETGGMGTTLLYALGALLVIGAGIALVVKRRMGSSK